MVHWIPPKPHQSISRPVSDFPETKQSGVWYSQVCYNRDKTGSQTQITCVSIFFLFMNQNTKIPHLLSPRLLLLNVVLNIRWSRPGFFSGSKTKYKLTPNHAWSLIYSWGAIGAVREICQLPRPTCTHPHKAIVWCRLTKHMFHLHSVPRHAKNRSKKHGNESDFRDLNFKFGICTGQIDRTVVSGKRKW